MKIRSIALSGVAILLLSSFVPTAHASKTPKPITSFQDAVNRPADVSYWAWKKSSDQILSSSAKSSALEIIVGPNTKLSNPNPQLAFDAVKRMYPTFRHPPKTYAIFYSFKDVDWAQKKYSEIFSMATGQEAKNSCRKAMSAGVPVELLTMKVMEFC
jgi:hypothetical protein